MSRIALVGNDRALREVIWTRLLSLHFGATVYTFALILAVFLVGLGIGSAIGATLSRSLPAPRRTLGWCQLLLWRRDRVGGVPAHRSLPYWPSTRRLPPRRGSRCSSIWSAAYGSCCPARSCGARAFRWRWRPSRLGACPRKTNTLLVGRLRRRKRREFAIRSGRSAAARSP